jgi:hypothetical protein
MNASLITASAAAQLLGITAGAFRRDFVARRAIPHIRLSPRRIRVAREDVEKLIEARTVKGVRA